MLVMLLNVKVRVLVKIEVLAVSLIPEGLQLGHNGVPGRDNSLFAKEESVQGPVHLLPIQGLAELLHVTPPAQFPPASMEDVVNRDHIGQETGSKGPSLSRVSRLAESLVWDKSMSNMGLYNKACRRLRHRGSLAGQMVRGLQSCHPYPRGRVLSRWDAGRN